MAETGDGIRGAWIAAGEPGTTANRFHGRDGAPLSVRFPRAGTSPPARAAVEKQTLPGKTHDACVTLFDRHPRA